MAIFIDSIKYYCQKQQYLASNFKNGNKPIHLTPYSEPESLQPEREGGRKSAMSFMIVFLQSDKIATERITHRFHSMHVLSLNGITGFCTLLNQQDGLD